MIGAFHAAAHIAMNCFPLNWNLPISFEMFRQAERAVQQQKLSLRPVTHQDLECPSQSKSHRRRGKSYPDKAVRHGPIYNKCNEFLEKALQSALAGVTPNPVRSETQTDISSSAVNSPTSNAKEIPKVQTVAQASVNPPTDASGDASEDVKPAEVSVSTESKSSSSDESVTGMEDDVSCIDETESVSEKVFYIDDTSSNHSTPAASPWGSLEPEASIHEDSTEIAQEPAIEVQHIGARTDFCIDRMENGELDLIGKGTFGSVFKGNYRGKEVAIKLTGIPTFRNETEGQVFARIGAHPNIIRLHTFYRDGCGTDKVETLVLDYAPADLSKVVNDIASNPYLDYTAFVTDCLADALAHIHKRGYAHLDVSPGNVLIMPDGVPKLTDFSSSLKWKIGDKPLEVYPVGTVGFRAPEVIGKHGYDTRADWFSLGVLVCYMINARLPWERDEIAQMDFIRSGKPGLANALPEAFCSVVSDLLSDEPNARITEDVLSFLTDETEL